MYIPTGDRIMTEQEKKNREKDRQAYREYVKLIEEIINQDTCGNGDSLLEEIGDGCIYNKRNYYQE